MSSHSAGAAGLMKLPKFSFEKVQVVEDQPYSEDGKDNIPPLKLDKHGLPLVPQPSDHEDDPLVSWPPTGHLLSMNTIQLTFDMAELVTVAEARSVDTDIVSVSREPNGISCGEPCICALGCRVQHYPSSSILRTRGIRECPSARAYQLSARVTDHWIF